MAGGSMKLPEITEDQKATLLFAIGMATGRAAEQQNWDMARAFTRLINHLMKDDPQWRPYAVPDEEPKK